MSKELIKIYLILDAIVIVVSLMVGNLWLLNSQISFILTMLVAFISVRSYKKLVDKELHSGKYDDLEDDEIVKIGKFKSAATIFSPLKLLAYILLGLSIYLLAKFQALNALAFLVGTLPYPLGALIYGIIKN